MKELTKITITLLGGSASGKTSLFSGINQAFVGGSVRLSDDYRICFKPVSISRSTPDMEKTADKIKSTVVTQTDLKKMCIDSEGGFNPATATMHYVEFTFEVHVNDEPVCLLMISDYAGELLDEPNCVPARMLNLLSEQVEKSDAFMILANAIRLSESFTGEGELSEHALNEVRLRNEVAAFSINSIFSLMHDKKDRTVLLAITQTDSMKVDKRISQDNFLSVGLILKERVFDKVFQTAQSRNWSQGMIPVSAVGRKADGSPNVDENNCILSDAEIHQENIDTALLFCVYNALMSQEKILNKELEKYKGMSGLLSQLNEEKRNHKESVQSQLQAVQTFCSAIASCPDLFDKIQ